MRIKRGWRGGPAGWSESFLTPAAHLRLRAWVTPRFTQAKGAACPPSSLLGTPCRTAPCAAPSPTTHAPALSFSHTHNNTQSRFKWEEEKEKINKSVFQHISLCCIDWLLFKTDTALAFWDTHSTHALRFVFHCVFPFRPLRGCVAFDLNLRKFVYFCFSISGNKCI